jgi:hypothetical protein
MASRPGTRVIRGVTPKKKADMEQAAALQRAGQNAYKVGNLQGAIDSFTQVRSPILYIPSRLIFICSSRLWLQTVKTLAFWIIAPPHIAG